MKLTEAGTLKRDGNKFLIQLISPGQGSSGTYTEESIKRAGTDRIFKAGTLMMIDHATDEGEWTRPEGSIRDLAAVLDEDARWDDRLSALVAEAKVFEHWRPILEDMKDNIGVSIRAAGEVEETADGRVITQITEARSVDFVTKAGRGGRILEILESERPSTLDGITQLFETSQPPAGGEKKEANMSMQEADSKNPFPPKDGGNSGDDNKGGDKAEIERLKKENSELKAEIAELKKTKAKEARHDHVASVVESEFAGVEDPAGVAELLIESFANGDASDEKITEAAKDRASKLGAKGQVQGMGQSTPLQESVVSNGLPTWDEIKAQKGL